MKHALVLGGGGAVGVAWESGVWAGLVDSGVELSSVEMVIGTSAGSIVGARLLAGFAPEMLRVGSGSGSARSSAPAVDIERVREVFRTWATAPVMTAEIARQLGALAAPLLREHETAFVESFVGLSLAGWPKTPLLITATEIATGERRAFGSDSGVPIERAIAASSAVPGIFPSVTIDQGLYMDGQVRSSTHADLLLDHRPEHVLIVMPTNRLTAPGIGAAAEQAVESEARALEAAGARVQLVTPTADEAQSFGGNLMDARQAPAAFEAGRGRGRALAQDSAIFQT